MLNTFGHLSTPWVAAPTGLRRGLAGPCGSCDGRELSDLCLNKTNMCLNTTNLCLNKTKRNNEMPYVQHVPPERIVSRSTTSSHARDPRRVPNSITRGQRFWTTVRSPRAKHPSGWTMTPYASLGVVGFGYRARLRAPRPQ